MALRPFPPAWLEDKSNDYELKDSESPFCCNPFCERYASQMHHIVRRSELIGPYVAVKVKGEWRANVCQVCGTCHDLLEKNEEQITLVRRQDGFWDFRWQKEQTEGVLNPYPQLSGGAEDLVDPGGEAPSNHGLLEATPVGGRGSEPHEGLAPGERCDHCGHRKAHPRKKSSPAARPYPIRVPVDEWDTFKETLVAVQAYIGVDSQPYPSFKAVILALAGVLQDEGLRDYGKR
jgi:hypothetical protein